MKSQIIITAFFISVLLSCKKDPGPGGKAHIQGHLLHNNTEVVGGTVRIWYGETNVSDPAAGYDDQITSNTQGEYDFHDLKKGDYFLYAVHTDSSGNPISGTLQVEIKTKSEQIIADIILQ